jgi:hypothetical protein
MDFGKVLTKAWEIVWKYKILWVFGLFASCSGQQSGYNFRGGGGGGGPSFQFEGDEIPYLPPEYYRFFMQVERFFEENAETIIYIIFGLVTFFLFLAVLFFLVGSLGRVGLIKGTLLAEAGAESLTFSEIFEESKPFFWRIVGLSLVVVLAVIVLVVVIGGIFALGAVLTLGIGVICMMPLICLLIPIMWYLGIVIKQANIALVVEDLDIFAALERGWNVTKDNLGNMIVMGVILVIGGAVVGFVIGLPQIFSFVPMITGFITGDYFTDFEALLRGISAVVVLQLIYLPIYIGLRSVLISYIESAWVLTYLENVGGESLEDESPPKLEEPAAA